MKNRPVIGLLGLMLELYDKSNPELRPQQEQFAAQLVTSLSRYGDVVFTGIQNTRPGVAEAVDEFIAQSADIIITVHFSYSPSLIALPELLRWKGPIVLWNTQRITGVGPDFGNLELLQNHGMHGVQDLGNTLNRVGRDYDVVTGHWEDPQALVQLEQWIKAAATANRLKSARIGQVGFAFQDMGDFGVDETLWLAQVGPHTLHIRLDALTDAMAKAPEDELLEIVAQDNVAFEVDPTLTPAEHLESARIEWALRNVMETMKLDGVAIHYEAMAADPRFDALPFAAAGKLLAQGYGFGGEGDVTSAAAVVAMQQLCGLASFTEMFTMDFDGGAIYLAHYAEANLQMARKGVKPRLVRREGWVGSGGVSTSLAFGFEPSAVTLINLTIGEGGEPKLIAFEAEILDFYLPHIDTPHCKLKPELDLPDFLNAYALEGGSHHLAISPGRHINAIRKLAQAIGINYTEI